MDRGRTVDRTGGPWTATGLDRNWTDRRSMDRDRTGLLDRGLTGPTVGQHCRKRNFFFEKKDRNSNIEFLLKSILMDNFEIPVYIS